MSVDNLKATWKSPNKYGWLSRVSKMADHFIDQFKLNQHRYTVGDSELIDVLFDSLDNKYLDLLIWMGKCAGGAYSRRQGQ